VTLVLDLLHRQGYPLTQAVVIHTSPAHKPIRAALARLRTEESHYRTCSPPVQFHYVPIVRDDGTCPADIVTEEDAGAVFRTLYRKVLEAKRHHCQVHLSVAGGRKVMSVYGMAVAQMLFEEGDCLWHLLSEGRLLAEKHLHPTSEEEAVLVPIPVLRWSGISPVATELALTEDPYQAVQKQRAWWKAEATQRKREFLEQDLTVAERKLVELLVGEPMSNRQLARRLHRSEKTVANQLTIIYRKFRDHFHLPRVDRTILIAELAPLLFPERGEEKGKTFPGKSGRISLAEGKEMG